MKILPVISLLWFVISHLFTNPFQTNIPIVFRCRMIEFPVLIRYIQMEFCGDGSLRDVLNQPNTPLSVRIDYFIQVWIRALLFHSY